MYVEIHAKSHDRDDSSGKTTWVWTEEFELGLRETDKPDEPPKQLEVKATFLYGRTDFSIDAGQGMLRSLLMHLDPADLQRLCRAAIDYVTSVN